MGKPDTTEGMFDVELTLGVKVRKQGTKDKWYASESKIDYTGMDYLQITATNGAVVKFADILAGLGFDAAKLKGFDPKIVDAAKASVS